MKHRRTILGLGLLSLVGLARASEAPADLLMRISKELERHAVVRANFIQTKQLAVVKRPVTSTGRVVFARQEGLLWQIEQPLRIGYVLQNDRMIELGSDGSRRQRNSRDMPGMSQIARIFQAVLGGDMASLGQYFEVQAQGTPAAWTLGLTPRQAQVARFIERIELSGNNLLQSVRLFEAGGDTTLIRFTGSVGATQLDDAERQLFSRGTP